MDSLRGRSVALVVTGSIAAYKAAEVARLLVKAGATVLPVMTKAATEFLGATTLSGITGHAAAIDMWDKAVSGELHVTLASRADVVCVAPATADSLSRFAHGRADDLVAALVLCARGPVVVAPAMHPRMWDHPATALNVRALEQQGRVRLVGPVVGEVASGEHGMGRMAAPEDIVSAVAAALGPPTKRDLAGKRIVVTAGPTVEDLDPVRFLGNRSTGKMGFAVAARAAARGAVVTLIAGPVNLTTPPDVRRTDVRRALDMQAALAATLGPSLDGADALVMTAAVADYRPRVPSDRKLKKEDDHAILELQKNPDLLAEVGARRARKTPVLVGFAVETGAPDEVAAYARKKLAAKKVDLVVANAAADAFGADENVAIFVTAEGDEPLGKMPKATLADRILDFVVAKLA